MSLSIIVPQYFMPPSSVKLGRFTTSINHPDHIYHDPPYDPTPRSSVSDYMSVAGLNDQSSRWTFLSALTSLVSASFSKHAKAQVEVSAVRADTYTLEDNGDCFEKATGMPGTRAWLEEKMGLGVDIYMVVGLHTVTDARIAQVSSKGLGASGQVNVPINLSLATVGAVSPLAGFVPSLDTSVQASTDRLGKIEASYIAPGKRVCAIRYCKLEPRWYSRKALDTARLREPWWECIEKRISRNEGEVDEDDIIEVEVVPILDEELEGDGDDWETKTVQGGDVLAIRIE